LDAFRRGGVNLEARYITSDTVGPAIDDAFYDGRPLVLIVSREHEVDTTVSVRTFGPLDRNRQPTHSSAVMPVHDAINRTREILGIAGPRPSPPARPPSPPRSRGRSPPRGGWGEIGEMPA
jgi:hypothetical protein